MSDSEGYADWIRLEQTGGIGPETARKLLGRFGLPENIFQASHSDLLEVVSGRVAAELTGPVPAQTLALIDKTRAWLDQPGNHVVTLADRHYPPRLLETADPPLILYAKGRRELLAQPSIAIVGSRNATAQGLANAEKFAEALGQAGLTIVSGMALGIDAAAHQGGLRSAGKDGNTGSTIAVIGTGADIVYPARNRALAHRIAEVGCIVSEYPLGMPGLAANFPRRNRIISGLSLGVLVVEAASQFGSLITARMASEQGREVFAIPGSIHSPLSKGCHQLIKQGAKLVESAQDILEEMGHCPLLLATENSATPQASQDPAADTVLQAMGFDPVSADTLAGRTGIDPALLNGQLLALELEELIEMLPGGIYQRIR